MLAAEPAAIAWSALPTAPIEAVLSQRQRFFPADPVGSVELAAAEPAFLDSDIRIEVPDVPGDLTAMIVETVDRQIADVGPLAPEHFLDANPDELNRMIAANLEAAGDFATGSVKPKPKSKSKSRSARAGGRKTPAPAPAQEPDFWSRLADLFTPRTT